jgi:hypothetical protein
MPTLTRRKTTAKKPPSRRMYNFTEDQTLMSSLLEWHHHVSKHKAYCEIETNLLVDEI